MEISPGLLIVLCGFQNSWKENGFLINCMLIILVAKDTHIHTPTMSTKEAFVVPLPTGTIKPPACESLRDSTTQ